MGETREVRTHIDAPADLIWSMITDLPRMGEWSPENEGGEWVDGATGPTVGARFKGRNRRGKSRWPTTLQVEVAEPGRDFQFLVGGDKPTARWRYQFIPDATGTEVVESFDLVRPLSKMDRIITRATIGVKDREADMEEGMRQTLAKLKAAAEAAAQNP